MKHFKTLFLSLTVLSSIQAFAYTKVQDPIVPFTYVGNAQVNSGTMYAQNFVDSDDGSNDGAYIEVLNPVLLTTDSPWKLGKYVAFDGDQADEYCNLGLGYNRMEISGSDAILDSNMLIATFIKDKVVVGKVSELEKMAKRKITHVLKSVTCH